MRQLIKIKNWFWGKRRVIVWGLGLAAPLVFVILFAPQQTHADFFGDIAYTVIGKVMFGFSWLISTIAAIGIAIQTWIIEVILNLNTQIVNSPAVKFGFPVSLSIANLGFTAAIIVIAIATILRISGYGIKEILWKLIVAALLVNFSLVFAGAILNFADQLTIYFLEQVNPAGEGNYFNNFATALSGAFNPQKGVLFEAGANELTTEDVDQNSGTNSIIGQSMGKLLLPIASLFVTILTLAAINITLGILVVMLLYRYVSIGILLILMPFAWLMWIFPGLKSNWDKWWHTFLKQVFFAPIVVFFLYLVVLVNSAMSEGQGASGSFGSTHSSTFKALETGFFTGLFSPIIEFALQAVLMVGLAIGGLFAANSLSIHGAAAGMAAMKGFAGKMGGWAKGKGIRAAGKVAGVVRAEKGLKAATSGLQGLRDRSKLARFFGAGLAAKGLGAGATGLTQLRVAGGENLVKAAAERIKGLSDSVLKTKHLSATNEEKIAIEQELMKRGELGDLNIHSTINDRNKKLYEQYDQKKAFEKLEKASTVNVEMMNLKRGGASRDKIDEAAREFYKTFEKKDVALMHINDMFSGKAKMGLDENTLKELGWSVAHGMTASMPSLVPNVISKSRASTLENFAPSYQGAMEQELAGYKIEMSRLAGLPSSLETEAQIQRITRLDEKMRQNVENFKNSMVRNSVGLGGFSYGGGGGEKE